jgi:hypothetical protein
MITLICDTVKIKIFIPFHPFHYRVPERSIVKEILGRRVKIYSPKDPIVFKKIFDTSKDKDDIKAILSSNPGRVDVKRIMTDAAQFLGDDSLSELEILIENFYRG